METRMGRVEQSHAALGQRVQDIAVQVELLTPSVVAIARLETNLAVVGKKLDKIEGDVSSRATSLKVLIGGLIAALITTGGTIIAAILTVAH
jgi:hypothetical protein